MSEERKTVRESMADITDIAPDFGRFVQEFVRDQVWSRPGLERKTRSLCTVAALAALGRELQLRAHIGLALQNGATREEIVEVLLHMSVYAGFPAAWNGLIVAKQVFTEQSE